MNWAIDLAALGVVAVIGLRLWRAWRGRRGIGEPDIVIDPATGERRRRCPSCRRGTVHFSKSRTPFERARRALSSRRIFRCDSCDWRGWLHVLDLVGDPPRPEAEAPILLEALDVAHNAERETSRQRRRRRRHA